MSPGASLIVVVLIAMGMLGLWGMFAPFFYGWLPQRRPEYVGRYVLALVLLFVAICVIAGLTWSHEQSSIGRYLSNAPPPLTVSPPHKTPPAQPSPTVPSLPATSPQTPIPNPPSWLPAGASSKAVASGLCELRDQNNKAAAVSDSPVKTPVIDAVAALKTILQAQVDATSDDHIDGLSSLLRQVSMRQYEPATPTDWPAAISVLQTEGYIDNVVVLTGEQGTWLYAGPSFTERCYSNFTFDVSE